MLTTSVVTTKQLVSLARRRTLVFIGPTAAGKDTLMNEVARGAGVPVLVSHTTRPRRPGEIHGVEYWFVTEETFMGLPMIEKRHYHVANGDVWHYGLSEVEGAKQGVLVLDWDGFLDYSAWCRARNIAAPASVFVPIEKKTAMRRQKVRGDYNAAEFERRWASDEQWTSVAAIRADYVWKEK